VASARPTLRWPDFGLTTLNNNRRQRKALRAILAGHPEDAQLAGIRDTQSTDLMVGTTSVRGLSDQLSDDRVNRQRTVADVDGQSKLFKYLLQQARACVSFPDKEGIMQPVPVALRRPKRQCECLAVPSPERGAAVDNAMAGHQPPQYVNPGRSREVGLWACRRRTVSCALRPRIGR